MTNMYHCFIIFASLNLLNIIWANGNSISSPVAAPSPAAVNCYEVIVDMADCLTFVSNGSTETQPEASCCMGLEEVLKVNAECLCDGLAKSAEFGVVLNISKASSLPSLCHLSAPSFSNCGIDLGPSADNVSPDPNSSGGATDSDAAPVPSPTKAASSTISTATVFLLVNIIIASLF